MLFLPHSRQITVIRLTSSLRVRVRVSSCQHSFPRPCRSALELFEVEWSSAEWPWSRWQMVKVYGKNVSQQLWCRSAPFEFKQSSIIVSGTPVPSLDR